MKNIFIWQGIGTHWMFCIYDEISKDKYQRLTEGIVAITQTFEKNYSRFLPDSYVSQLSAKGELTNFPHELYEMLLYSQKISEITHNAFSVTIANKLEEYGYDSKYSFTKKESALNGSVLELTPKKITLLPGTKLDLGGIGKGWLLDKLAMHLKAEGIQYFYINGGGDIVATSNFEKEIEFDLENPSNTDETIGKISIKDSAIACSAPNRRQWTDKLSGKMYHHLINNKSGELITDLKAIFTYGKTALHADSASTALFVSDFEDYKLIKEFFNVEYLLITSDNNAIRTNNYPGKLFS